MILSTSSISVALQCRRRWLYKYVHRVPGRQSVPPAIGSAVHAAVEARHEGKSPADALVTTWLRETATVPPADLAEDPDALADAATALAGYVKHVAPNWHPTMVERRFSYQLEGVTITGIIDSADERIDEARDLKVTTGKSIAGRKPPRFRPEAYQLQRDLYDLGYESITGRPLRRFQLDVLTRRGTYRTFVLPPTFRDTLDTVSVVRDALQAGDYSPTGAWNGSCHWCPYTSICPDSTETEDTDTLETPE